MTAASRLWPPRSRSLAFFLGADEVDYALFAGTFKVYVGHHGDKGAHHADVILPGAAYSEKSGTYVNLEGRVQRGERAVFPPGDAREDWAIFRALSDVLGKRLPFDTIEALRAEMAKAVPALGVEGLANYGWSEPKLPRHGQRQNRRLSDQGFLPHQRHLPRIGNDAALLGRTGAWRSSFWRRRNECISNSFHIVLLGEAGRGVLFPQCDLCAFCVNQKKIISSQRLSE